MQAQLPNMDFFPFREQGASVDKRHDGGCRKELAAVSVSSTMKEQVLVPLMSRETWPASLVASGASVVLQHREDFTFYTRNTHYPQ